MNIQRRRFKSPFSELYSEARLLPDIRKSMFFMLLSNIFGNLHITICGSGTTSMIQLSNFLGAGDLEYGFITGLPLAAALLQIPFSILVSRTQKRRKYLLTYGLFSRVIWLLFGLIPFAFPDMAPSFRLWAVIFLLGISSCSGSFINVCWMPWMADLLPMNVRGRWISKRDSINAVFGVLMGLGSAYILDTVAGPLKYTIVFLIGGVFGTLDMLCYFFVKEVYHSSPVRTNFRSAVRRIWDDKPFMWFMLFWTVWCFCANLSGSYLARYAMNEMGITNMQYTIFGTLAASSITIVVISHWGKLLDRYGCKPIMWISGVAAAVTQAFYLFSVPGSVVPTFLHCFIGAAFWNAAGLAATSMQLSYSPDEHRPSYIAFFSCVTSLAGAFAGILAGGVLLEWMESIGIPGNTGFDRYKILVTGAVILRLTFVILLVPRLKNDREGTVAQMRQDFTRRFRTLFRVPR